MTEIFSPNIVLLSTLLLGMLTLPASWTSHGDSKRRTFLLLLVTFLFFLNVILIDWLFLEGVEAHIELFAIGKYSIAINFEPLGLIFLSLIGVMWNFALMYTVKFLRINDMGHSDRFIFFVNCCMMCGVMIALSANLFTMFVFYELLTVCTIPLIAHKGGTTVRDGMINYLRILMLSALLLFLPAMVIIYSTFGHGNFELDGFIAGHFSKNFSITLLLMFIFGIAKAAIFPLHKWLPNAMVASYPVSALLHAVVVVKTGLFCIYKVLMYVFGLTYLQQLFAEHNWLVYLPIATIIYSSFQALRFNQIKMVLAYSTINQLSIAILSAFLLSPKGIAAAVMHMISHSFTKICIFYAAGNIYSVKNAYDVGELIGIRSTMPKTSFIMLIAGLSLMGMPPFAGFISKFYIMLAAAEQENILVMLVLAASTIFSAIYMIKMLIFIYRPISDNFILNLRLKPYFDEPVDKRHPRRVINFKHQAERKLPKMMLLSLFGCLSGVVFFVFLQGVINRFLLYV